MKIAVYIEFKECKISYLFIIQKLKAEDKLNRLGSLDKIKSQEIDLMNQKIKDFELILDENSNEHIESIKSLKMELERYKIMNNEHEKFYEILNYFLKKMNSFYNTHHKNNESQYEK